MNVETFGDDQDLEDVLDAYVAAGHPPSHERLVAWTRRYPRYARELAEFTANWSAVTWLPPAAAPVDEAVLVRRGLSAIGGLVRERVASRGAAALPASLLEEARSRGLSVEALAGRAGLSVPLMLKLERRLIRYATVPRQVVESVAGALGRDVAGVAAYLQRGPQLAAGASYHARTAPALAGQEDFATAVRADMTLSEERRSHLLALPPIEQAAGNERDAE